MRIGSLFSGIGGLELGLEWAGVGETIWQVEQDPFCRRVLERHWPNATRFDDVRTVGRANLAAVDLICGGSPCQDFSLAGKRAGLDGARSGLWFEFARIVRDIRPRFVVFENVPGILSPIRDDGGSVVSSAPAWTVLGDLASADYDAVGLPLSASGVGAGHERERVFFVAFDSRIGRGSRGARRPTASRQREREQALLALVADVDMCVGKHLRKDDAEQESGRGRRQSVDRGEASLTHADGLRKLQPEGPVTVKRRRPTHSGRQGNSGATEPGMVRAVHGLPGGMDGRFAASVYEPQGEWEAPRTATRSKGDGAADRMRALGNAVVPEVAYVIGCIVNEIAGATP